MLSGELTVVQAPMFDGLSNVKPIGEGAAELRIDRRPGYCIYFGWGGTTLVILLDGGTKRRQQNDIPDALEHWRDCRMRKRAGIGKGR